ncbi:hypothetical protein QTP86_005015 [Hemibagrus guttatus]|nr:hypothetical protein QTP86_005015 [Hemibagrus guttatus]
MGEIGDIRSRRYPEIGDRRHLSQRNHPAKLDDYTGPFLEAGKSMPWITSDIKGLLNQKKRAFMDGDQQVLKCVQRELKVHLREVKEQYKRKRNKMKKITGCSSKRGDTIEGDVGIANQ